jgi:outer membrane receptor protein involved in Fe transport
MRGYWIANVFVLSCLTALNPAPAQVSTATFYGIATDATRAVVPGAVVTFSNDQNATVYHKTADSAGEFGFDFLPVGTYTLRIEAQGFKTYETRGIALTAGQQVRQTFTLEVGSISETVSVASTAPLLNAVSAEQQQSMESSEVSQLPVQRRNISNIFAIGTGVSNAGGAVRMNGFGRAGSAYSVDGTNASGATENRLASTYGVSDYVDIMSMEGVAEVQTIKGVMPAEYGDALGGHVNLITKSGTNQIHASLFENFQSEELNARNQLLSSKAPLTFNQFGGSAGGAIRKNRIFVFGDYEGYREAAFTVVQGTVPTASTRAALLAAVPSYNLALSIMPLPNQPTAANASTGTYLAASTGRHTDNHVDAKGDIIITDNSRLSLTYSRGRPFQDVPAIFIGGAGDREFFNTLERGAASFTIGGASWTSESRVGYNRADLQRTDAFFSLRNPDKSTEQFEWGERIPLITTSLGWSTASTELWDSEGPTWSADQKISKQIGKHSLKFGGSYLNQCCTRTNPQNPGFQYNTMAELLSNTPSTISVSFGNGLYTAHLYEFGFFAQDDYRITKNLVLNIGLRYDYYSNLVAHPNPNGGQGTGFYNPNGLLDQNFHVGPTRSPDNPYNPDAGLNLGPRFGFSYSPGSSAKTVIRGGFGIVFSAQVPGSMWQSVQSDRNVPFRSNLSQQDVLNFGVKWPLYNDDFHQIVAQQAVTNGVTNIFTVYDPNIQNPYTMHYTLGFQRELTSSLMIESAFVGVRGVKLLAERIIDPPDRLTGQRPNPLLASTYYADDSQQSSYSSWQTSLRKRYSRHLTGSANYTWGKGLSTEGGDISPYYGSDTNPNYIQNFFDMKSARGPSAGDVTHYFVSEWLYELPVLANWNALRYALGGWQASGIFTAQTGGALILTESSGLAGSRPDYIGGSPILSNYRSTLQYLNPAAFARVPVSSVSAETIRAGNIGTGAIRGPGLWNLDFSMAKNFTITERLHLQFRADLFNALNHTVLSGLSVEITNPRFGQLTSTNGARLMQLNARLSW